MKNLIIDKLRELEKSENIRILHAVESGSRAWGFASPDSDYDVRFIYVRPLEEYLKLEGSKDVTELPISDNLDINGWDLSKTLRLLYKSNPTVFEWFSSPIVYIKTDFSDTLKEKVNGYFSSKKGLYHYISMASGNYREFLRGENVKAKKYFYVLRPVLACRWILEKKTPPPMLFSELAEAELPIKLSAQIEKLLQIKMNTPETKYIPRINELNEYLDTSIEEIKTLLMKLPDEKNSGWEELNNVFLKELGVRE